MAYIDDIIVEMEKFAYDRLKIIGNRYIVGFFGAERATARQVETSTKLRKQEVEDIIREIVPKDLERQLYQQGKFRFPYRARSGFLYHIECIREGETFGFNVRPYSVGKASTSFTPPSTPMPPARAANTGDSKAASFPAPDTNPQNSPLANSEIVKTFAYILVVFGMGVLIFGMVITGLISLLGPIVGPLLPYFWPTVIGCGILWLLYASGALEGCGFGLGAALGCCLFIGLLFVLFAPSDQHQPSVNGGKSPSSIPATNTGATVTSRFDVSSLVLKTATIEGVIQALGTPNEDNSEPTPENIQAGTTDWAKGWVSGSTHLVVGYDINSRAITDFYLTDDVLASSGTVTDHQGLLALGNLSEDSVGYICQFNSGGVDVTPAQGLH